MLYGFKNQYRDLIISGSKLLTIREPRKDDRHARPGDMLQLYTGLRTKQASKIIPDQKCTFRCGIRIYRSCRVVLSLLGRGIEIREERLGAFAKIDGFDGPISFLDFHMGNGVTVDKEVIGWGPWEGFRLERFVEWLDGPLLFEKY